MSTDKHQVLETITAVSRLISLAFKKSGTKIAIRDHRVILCDPTNDKFGTLQGIQIVSVTEPATLGLITAFGGGLLFVRRLM